MKCWQNYCNPKSRIRRWKLILFVLTKSVYPVRKNGWNLRPLTRSRQRLDYRVRTVLYLIFKLFFSSTRAQNNPFESQVTAPETLLKTSYTTRIYESENSFLQNRIHINFKVQFKNNAREYDGSFNSIYNSNDYELNYSGQYNVPTGCLALFNGFYSFYFNRLL